MRARYGVVPGDMVQLSLTLAVWRPRGIRRSEHHAPHFAASPRACRLGHKSWIYSCSGSGGFAHDHANTKFSLGRENFQHLGGMAHSHGQLSWWYDSVPHTTMHIPRRPLRPASHDSPGPAPRDPPALPPPPQPNRNPRPNQTATVLLAGGGVDGCAYIW